MQRTSFTCAIAVAVALTPGSLVQGQPSGAYFQAVTNLNPAGYWPLNETARPPQPFAQSLIPYNLGSLGTSITGYYGAWYQPFGNSWYLTNDIAQATNVTYQFDGSMAMVSGGPGQYVIVPRNTNGVNNPSVTLNPPFSIEAWLQIGRTNSALGDIISQGGFANLETGGPNTNNPFYGGPVDNAWAGVELGQYQDYIFLICQATNGQSKANELDTSSYNTFTGFKVGQWVHVVATFDGVTEMLYTNSVLCAQKTVGANAAGLQYVADPTTPLMIGSGTEPSASYGLGWLGTMGDVAIYSSVLPASSVLTHFETAYGTNATFGGNYSNAVLADSPVLYYRLNDPQTVTNAGYPVSSFPVATNYGSLGAAANGAYQPGTAPGAAGPAYAGFGADSKAVAINGWFGGVDVGSGNLPAALNPTNTSPLTLVSWFQGNMADSPGRFQEIVGHGDASYRLALGQAAGDNHFNPGPGPELQFANPQDVITNGFALNDGNWHMAAGVCDGTNEYLYLDGLLAKSSNNPAGIKIAGNAADLLIGGDSQYTYASASSANTLRNFDGQVAHVAFWTNALSQAQIQSLFNAAGVSPSIYAQPIGATNNQGGAVTIDTTVRGSQPITYQWWNANGTRVAGQTNLQLTFNPVTTNQIGSYYLVASSPYGRATSSVVQVYVYGPPAIISQSQANLQIFAGQNPVLTVVASGAATLAYQWLSNNVAIPSATASSYSIADARTSASYTCRVTNGVGSLTAGPFTVTIVPDPAAPYPAQVLADHPITFWRLDETNGTTAFDYVSGYNGIYTNVQLNYLPGSQGYHPNSDPNEGAPGFATSYPALTNNSYVGWVLTNLNFVTPSNVNAEFSVECWLQEQFALNESGIVSIGYGNGGEEFAMDLGANATTHALRFYAHQANGTTGIANTTFPPGTDSAWHHVVGVCDEASSSIIFYIDGTNAGQGTMAAKSGILNSIEPLTIGARQEGLNTQYDDQFFGSISQVAIYNYALSPSQVQTHYLASGIAPAVNPTPSSQTTNSGSTATFDAGATGTAPLSYQWYDPNNKLISTNAILTLPNVRQSAAGQYTIVASNAYGSATGYVNLQVAFGAPQITQDVTPLSQTIELYSGLNDVSYAVIVSGSEPFAYQWYQNGHPVFNATNPTYAFTALAGTNTYYVSVTNAYTASQAGGVPAQSSMATVIGIPVLQLNPTNFAYRIKISFPGYTGTPITNFPALITLSPSSVPGLEYSQFAAEGSDLVFADVSGTSILPSEIDEWNDAGLSSIWVGIPLLNGSNIWAYWGNTGAAPQTPPSSNVWLNAGYQIVYHLKETNFPYADGTGQYPATGGVAPAQTPGVVGHGQSFNGTSDYLTPGAVTLSNMFTTYAWIYLNPTDNNIQTIWANQFGGYGANGFTWFIDSYNTADHTMHADSGNGAGSGYDLFNGDVPFGAWHLATATWDQTQSHVNTYLDGVLLDSGTAVSTFGLTNSLFLGSFLNPAFEFNGDMDEARIQNGAASPNWIVTTYLNMANSSFVSYSSVNLEPTLSISSSASGYTFAWPTNEGNFLLESATNLARTAVWTGVTTPPPAITNGVWQQTIPANPTGSHYYRLQGQ